MTNDEQTNEIVELNTEETKAVVGGAGEAAGEKRVMQPVSAEMYKGPAHRGDMLPAPAPEPHKH
jgi:hypothetical protein